MSARWRNLLGVALSVGLLWWTFRGQDPAVIWGNLRDANLWYLLAAMVTGTLIFPLRAIRWRVILDPIAPDIPLYDLWRATAIGMVGNNVLPARAGEFARAYVLSKETERVTFSAAFASLAVDRVFDAFVVLLLMLAAMMSPSFPDLPDRRPARARLRDRRPIVATAALGALYLIVFFPQCDHHDLRMARAQGGAAVRGAGARAAALVRLGARRAPASVALLPSAPLDGRALAAQRPRVPAALSRPWASRRRSAPRSCCRG